MKNKEKFAKEIVELALRNKAIAFNGKGQIFSCADLGCANCIFSEGLESCVDNRKKWAESEYVDPKIFTEEEKAIVSGEIKQIYRDEELDEIVKERDEYKNRIRLTERALFRACGSSQMMLVFLQQAEKELEEKRKDV